MIERERNREEEKKRKRQVMMMSKQSLKDDNCQECLTNGCKQANEKDVYII